MYIFILTPDILLLFRYESIIATLCENLDSLDEPDARAAMIWIVGEYAERIDNADELLESFLEGFHDESTQVRPDILIAISSALLKAHFVSRVVLHG